MLLKWGGLPSDLAQREYVYSTVYGSSFVHHLARGNENFPQAFLFTPQGYSHYEGRAETLYNSISELTEHGLLETSGLTERPTVEHFMRAISIVWFFEAAKSFGIDSAETFNLLRDSSEAAKCAAFECGLATSIEDTDGTTHAKNMALLRHKENRSLIEQAAKYWRESIDHTLSAQKAANELLRIVPLSHKKLAEVVSAEKKKVQAK